MGARPPGDRLRRRFFARRQDMGDTISGRGRQRAAGTTSTCPRANADSSGSRSSVARPTRSRLREITVEPLKWSASKNAFFAAVARDAPPGNYPKYLSGVQSYWTVAGAGRRPGRGARQRRRNGRGAEGWLLRRTVRVRRRQALHVARCQNHSVARRRALSGAERHVDGRRLAAHARASCRARRPRLIDRLPSVSARERRSRRRPCELYLAIRPFQVNPPWQFLNTPGGVATSASWRRGQVVR